MHRKVGISATGAPKTKLRHGSGPILTRRLLVSGILIILSLVILFLPSPYVIEAPGPTLNVLGRSGTTQVITIRGGKVYKSSGKLLLTTINARGIPGYPVTNLDAFIGWADPSSMVLPREAVVPQGQSAEEYKAQEGHEMKGAQGVATSQALSFLRSKGYQVSGVKMTMHVEDIGGPSAGMMYTLGAIDKMTPEDETGGKTIAGTGTIDRKGAVGPIGGIRLKMLGARRDGATWFLAPEANCDQVVGHVPSGLRDVRVSTLDQAYEALVAIGQGRADKLPRCTASESGGSHSK